MNSTLRLIYNSPLLPERNFKLDSIDDIADGSDGALIINNFQYIKHSLDLTIKIDFSQYGLEFDRTKNINYLTIQNNGNELNPTKLVGYFVMNKRWLSEHTIELTLHCDTINSFLDSCELSNKTKVLREHKNRFIFTGGRFYGISNVQNAPFVESDIDDTELGVYESYSMVQQTSCEFTLMLNINSLKSLPYVDEHYEPYEIHIDGSDAGSLTAHYDIYTLDENHKILRKIDSFNYDDIIFDFDDGVYDGNVRVVLQTTEKYIAIRCQYTFEEPSELTYVDIDYSIRYKYGQWEDITPTEINEIHDGFNDVKNTLFSTGEYTATFDPVIMKPIVDRYSERINPMLFGGFNRQLYEEDDGLNQSWYLVYENQNAPSESLQNPVDVYLYASNKSKIASKPSFNGTLSIADIQVLLARANGFNTWGEYWDFITNTGEDYRQTTFLYVVGYWNNNGRIQSNQNDDFGESIDITFSGAGLVRFRAGASLQYPIIVDAQDSNGDWHIYTGKSTNTFTFTDCKTANAGEWTNDEWTASGYAQFNMFGTSGTSQDVYGIASLDRTDPKLIKVIKCPYCPASVYFKSGVLNYDSDQWEYNASRHTLKLKNFNTKLVRTLEFSVNPFGPLNTQSYDEPPLEKSDEYEPKLYHSDFYQPKFVYDSFSFIFQLEYMTDYVDRNNFRIQYNVSNTINSRFLFTFIDYICKDNEVSDYNNILYVARNNDCVIFNQQYVNYIRNGFNYDKKSFEMNREYQWEQFGRATAVGGFQSGLSLFKQYSKSDAGGMAGTIVSRFDATISSLMNIQHSIAQAELDLAARQNQLAHQSTGVIDANDVDLLEAYTKNQAKLKIYKISPRMKLALYNLFFLTGYVCEEQRLPDTTSRTRFNFVQADIIFKSTPNLPTAMMEDIKQRYSGGITFLHKYKGTYDFEQQYENWEIDYVNRF